MTLGINPSFLPKCANTKCKNFVIINDKDTGLKNLFCEVCRIKLRKNKIEKRHIEEDISRLKIQSRLTEW